MSNDIHDDIKDPEKVLKIVREFIDEFGIHEVDVIQESARVIENAEELIEALCEAAGWAIPEGAEEEDIHIADYDEDNPAYMGDDY